MDNGNSGMEMVRGANRTMEIFLFRLGRVSFGKKRKTKVSFNPKRSDVTDKFYFSVTNICSMVFKLRVIRVLLVCFFSLVSSVTMSQESEALEGRWNLTIQKDGEELPSWLEITHSGNHTLVGRFVYAFGSARPISEISYEKTTFRFEIPPQWEPGGSNMIFEGDLVGDALNGTMVYTDGKRYDWTAVKAPKLKYRAAPNWGGTVALFDGESLNGWHAEGENQWIVEEGILKSPASGSNLVSDRKFSDFKLKAEFRYPEDSNSGLYLRGRYEVQIADNYGKEASSVYFGGVYGFLTPNEMVAKKAGEWQTFEITLIGRRVTVIANGTTIINDQNIPGMTGGALDNKEAQPGPIFIQGDHGPIDFRKIEITPIVE